MPSTFSQCAEKAFLLCLTTFSYLQYCLLFSENSFPLANWHTFFFLFVFYFISYFDSIICCWAFESMALSKLRVKIEEENRIFFHCFRFYGRENALAARKWRANGRKQELGKIDEMRRKGLTQPAQHNEMFYCSLNNSYVQNGKMRKLDGAVFSLWTIAYYYNFFPSFFQQ